MATAQRKSRTVSEVFTEAYEKNPKLSYLDLAEGVSLLVGYRVNDELVRNYHLGTTKQRPNIAVIAAIAACYGLKARDLPDDIIDLCAHARAVFERIGVPSTPPGIRTPNLQISHAA